MSDEGDKQFVVIEPGAEAFIFTEPENQPPSPTEGTPPIPARIMHELRGLLPTVKRIRPIEARLQSGETLKVYAPPA